MGAQTTAHFFYFCRFRSTLGVPRKRFENFVELGAPFGYLGKYLKNHPMVRAKDRLHHNIIATSRWRDKSAREKCLSKQDRKGARAEVSLDPDDKKPRVIRKEETRSPSDQSARRRQTQQSITSHVSHGSAGTCAARLLLSCCVFVREAMTHGRGSWQSKTPCNYRHFSVFPGKSFDFRSCQCPPL